MIGIYKITSPTEKIYIGQSVDLDRRILTYKSNINNTVNQKILHNSLLKYGIENHTFEIIEECLEEDLNCRERYWQDFYDVLNREKGLNCVLQPCNEARKVLSEETRHKMSLAVSGEKNGMWQYKFSEEQLQKMRNRKGEKSSFYGKKVTEEMKEKRRVTMMKKGMDSRGSTNPNAREVIDTITKEVYQTVTEAAEKNNVSLGVMSGYLTGKKSNFTSCMYLKDYKDGMIITPHKKINRRAVKIIDVSTGTIYSSISEAINLLNLDIPYSSLVTAIRKEDERTTLRILDNYQVEITD